MLIALLLLTAPVATHAIASAAYRIGIPMKQPIRDDLVKEADEQARSEQTP